MKYIGVNRTIVELKRTLQKFFIPYCIGVNRTIVELKRGIKK